MRHRNRTPHLLQVLPAMRAVGEMALDEHQDSLGQRAIQIRVDIFDEFSTPV
jgi:hypothetical protein